MSGAEIPVIAAVVGAGASAYGTFSQVQAGNAQKDSLQSTRESNLLASKEQAEAYEFESRQYERRGKAIRTAAAQDEAKRYDDLESSLETISAIRSGRGVDLDSPTGRAISDSVSAKALTDIRTSKSNYALEATSGDLASALAARKAAFTTYAGQMGYDAGEASIRAADAGINAAIAGGIGRIAGLGLDYARGPRMRP
ncbi:MAG: hypothetical protein LC750_00530 [Actinobacteria bacterium]|nr:hypothetical protein [Actinomycetota bacterium]